MPFAFGLEEKSILELLDVVQEIASKIIDKEVKDSE